MDNMDMYTSTMIAEGVEDATEESQLEAWQYLVDTGLAWQLQGWFGRTAMNLIEQGLIQDRGRINKVHDEYLDV